MNKKKQKNFGNFAPRYGVAHLAGDKFFRGLIQSFVRVQKGV
jgi:hypothetical protein